MRRPLGLCVYPQHPVMLWCPWLLTGWSGAMGPDTHREGEHDRAHCPAE